MEVAAYKDATMASRVAGIFPGLDLAKDPANRAPAYARLDGRKGVLGNGFLELQIDYRHDNLGVGSFLNKITGELIDLEFVPFLAWFNEGTVKAREAVFGPIHARGTASVATLVTRVSHEWFDADIMLAIKKSAHFAQKTIIFHNVSQPLRLERLALCRHRFPGDVEIVVHDGGASFPIVFVRGKESSLFYCGDYPGYFASKESGDQFSFDYSPGEELEPGRSLQTLPAHMGICVRTGRWMDNAFHESGVPLDVGEAQWFREHLTAHVPPVELPYVEMHGGDCSTAGGSDVESIAMAGELGIRHVLLPKWLRAVDACPYGTRVVQRLRAGSIGATLMIPHDTTDHPEWVAIGENGAPVGPKEGPCFASEPFRRSMVESYEVLLEGHVFTNAEVCASPIVVCHSANHGHTPGRESLQKAFQGLADVAEALREDCGHVRCAGPYGSYGGGIARMFDSVPLLAPPHPLPIPDLHVGRLFADMQRLYYRRSRSFLMPKASLSNAVGLVPDAAPQNGYAGAEHYPWHLYHDSVGWEYGLISALATGVRHTLYALPNQLSEKEILFTRKWLAWEKERLDDLREGEDLLEGPGNDSVDVYAYASSRGALIFAFNTSYDEQDATLCLALAHDCDYVAREIYPREMNYLGPNQGLFQRDSEVPVHLNPKEARVIEIVRRSPASAKRKRPEIFGVEAVEERDRLLLRAPRGQAVEVGVRLRNEFTSQQIAFPGEAHAQHIRDWTRVIAPFEARHGDLCTGNFDGVPLSPQDGVLHNAWLSATFSVPEDLNNHLDLSPFVLNRPSWAFPNRLFFVVRFEPELRCEPIATSSAHTGIPEAYAGQTPIPCGMDLAPENIRLAAWVNGQEREVHPARAVWRRWTPNQAPIVAYFFEAGSCLDLGGPNRVVLYVNRMNSADFRGIFMEHYPQIMTETALRHS
jgi:hypothetical protein